MQGNFVIDPDTDMCLPIRRAASLHTAGPGLACALDTLAGGNTLLQSTSNGNTEILPTRLVRINGKTMLNIP